MEFGHTQLSKEETPIRAIHQMSGDDNYAVGTRGVTKIVAYDEQGQMDWVPWVAVYAGDRIWARMPAATLKIYYL